MNNDDEVCYCAQCERFRWGCTAIRSYHRLFTIRTDGWDEAEGCDRHWDGGEWSGPAWARNWEDEQRRTLADVAARFGIDADDLYEWVEHWQHVELSKMYDAMTTMMRIR